MLKCIDFKNEPVSCAKCKRETLVSIVSLTTYEGELCSTWVSAHLGWAVRFDENRYEYLCPNCVGSFYRAEQIQIVEKMLALAENEIELLKRIDEKMSRIATRSDPTEPTIPTEPTEPTEPTVLPDRQQEGVDENGQAWCFRCPDGACYGAAVLDGCDIRKENGIPLPEGIPYVNLDVKKEVKT